MTDVETRLRALAVESFTLGSVIPLGDALEAVGDVEVGLGADHHNFRRGYEAAVLVGRLIAKDMEPPQIRAVMAALLDGITRFLEPDVSAPSTDTERGKPTTSAGGSKRTGGRYVA